VVDFSKLSETDININIIQI